MSVSDASEQTGRPTYTAWAGRSGISTSDRDEALALAAEWAGNGEESYVEETVTVTTTTVIWTHSDSGGEQVQ